MAHPSAPGDKGQNHRQNHIASPALLLTFFKLNFLFVCLFSWLVCCYLSEIGSSMDLPHPLSRLEHILQFGCIMSTSAQSLPDGLWDVYTQCLFPPFGPDTEDIHVYVCCKGSMTLSCGLWRATSSGTLPKGLYHLDLAGCPEDTWASHML